ncbi:MAG: hypothetical protein FWF75_05180 [Propionibacteriaceae bacterium]|nr:hypothetical protein [Propionibacteriaceae bacterium]
MVRPGAVLAVGLCLTQLVSITGVAPSFAAPSTGGQGVSAQLSTDIIAWLSSS